MKIVFENDNFYSVSPIGMATEIINALAKRVDDNISTPYDEVVNGYFDICKTIEFLEIWRKQNQPRFEKELGYSKIE